MLLANAFYVAAEFAAVSSSKPKLEAQAEDQVREADYVSETVSDEYRMDRYIACAQVGITLSSLVIGFYGQRALAPYVSPLLEGVLPSGVAAVSITAPIILIVLTMLQVIFGELFPKSIAVRSPERVAIGTAQPMRWSLRILGPFVSLLNGSALWIMRRLGLDKPKEAGDEHSHEELRQLIAESLEGGVIERPAHEMLRQVLAFQDRIVRDVMQPRSRIRSLAPGITAREAVADMLDSSFTRFPVLDRSDAERPRGFVHLRDIHDLSREDPEAGIDGALRDILVIPDTLSLAEAWSRLKEDHAAFGLVFNEYGIVSGLISVEDIVEEIIGEVVDEFDEEEPRIRRRRGRVVLRGDLSVAEVNRKFDLHLPEDRAESISGLVAVELGVGDPTRGARVRIADTPLMIESVENGLPRLVSFARTSKEAVE